LLFVVADDAVALRLIGAIVQRADLATGPTVAPLMLRSKSMQGSAAASGDTALPGGRCIWAAIRWGRVDLCS
jgi:hypothetical protein